MNDMGMIKELIFFPFRFVAPRSRRYKCFQFTDSIDCLRRAMGLGKPVGKGKADGAGKGSLFNWRKRPEHVRVACTCSRHAPSWVQMGSRG